MPFLLNNVISLLLLVMLPAYQATMTVVAITIVILLAIPQDREDDRMARADMAIPHIFDCRSSLHRLQA